VLSVLIWCFTYNRWTIEAWETPLEYGITPETADAKSVLASIKASSEGHIVPLLPKHIPELGAPYGADWDDCPLVEQPLFWLTGLAAKLCGVFTAANLAVLVAQVLAALAFYVTCRSLKCDWAWAMSGALVFAFARMAIARQIHHLPVTFYWHVPLCLLVCWWISGGELQWRNKLHWIGLGIGVITGIQNPYYTNMFLQLAALATVFRALDRDWKSAAAGASIILTTFGIFLLMNANMVLYHLLQGPNIGSIVRVYEWLEVFALKPLDLFMPPPDHPIAWLANYARSYREHVLVPGETPPSNYLGLVGIASLFWLVLVAAKNTVSRPRMPIPVEAWQVMWIFCYSTIGGINGFLGTLGIQLFRSTNRLSIFILAIALVFSVKSLSRLNWSRSKVVIFATLLTMVALLDQIPPPPVTASIRQTAEIVAADRQFVLQIERRLPRGAMIFQLPPCPYPESSAPGIPAYDYFRPYLFSRSLRYSYGSIKGRSRDNWQFTIGRNGIIAAVSDLESYGFRAIYIQKNGFQDYGAGLLHALADAGKSEVIEHPNGEIALLILKPRANPVLPR